MLSWSAAEMEQFRGGEGGGTWYLGDLENVGIELTLEAGVWGSISEHTVQPNPGTS